VKIARGNKSTHLKKHGREGKKISRSKQIVSKIKVHSRQFTKYGRAFFVVFGVFVLVLISVFLAFAYDYEGKVFPNVYLKDKNLSGLTGSKLSDEISGVGQKYEGDEITIAIKDSDKEKKIKIGELGWKIDIQETARKAYSVGRNKNKFFAFFEKISSLVHKRRIIPVYIVNENALNDWLNLVQNELGKPKQEGNLKVTYKSVSVIEPQSGEMIDENEIRPKVAKIFELNGDPKIVTELHEDKPSISKEDAESMIEETKKLTLNDVTLDSPRGDYTLENSYIRSWVELKRNATVERSMLKKEVKYGPVYVSFSQDEIKSYLEKRLDSFNIPARDARLTFSEGKVGVFQEAVQGEIIDLSRSAESIMWALEKGETNVKLSDKVQEPAINAQTIRDIDKYGIKELIGTATTDFSGSPSNRIHNIKTGTDFLSGVLIKPGEEFSTVGHLGSIDGSSGYLPELVIKEDSTVPEFGGGLCQVSTTLFRSVMNTGLKITERQNHSYRVGYYEPPVGMDATIYSPKPDFKFVNNTSAYILIQGRVEGNKIIFDFYGTKDNRQVEISNPEMYDVTPPGGTIYIDNPSMPQGEERQIERAHNGAKASFTYRVIKDGQEIVNQKFVSAYVPWPAKILRGTGEPAPEGSE